MSEAFVEGLTKAYGEKAAVDHLSISVPRGTVFGLLGANGAGKSTTIECILGTKQAGALASVLYFPMLIFSGTTLPIEVMPRTMQRVVSLFPLTQGIAMMKNSFLGIRTGSILLPVCVMLALTALCTWLSVRFFRWE